MIVVVPSNIWYHRYATNREMFQSPYTLFTGAAVTNFALQKSVDNFFFYFRLTSGRINTVKARAVVVASIVYYWIEGNILDLELFS